MLRHGRVRRLGAPSVQQGHRAEKQRLESALSLGLPWISVHVISPPGHPPSVWVEYCPCWPECWDVGCGQCLCLALVLGVCWGREEAAEVSLKLWHDREG